MNSIATATRTARTPGLPLEHDLPAFYARHYREGMTDLSRNNPQPLPVTLPALDGVSLESVRPPGGGRTLRAAISRMYRTLGEDDILLCSGASEALAALSLALGEPGTEAICSPGTYPSATAVSQATGGHRAGFDGERDASFAVASNGTVPDGQRFDVAGFVAQATAIGAVPVVDEVHRHIVLDDGEVPAAAADLDPRAVSIGDLSKPLGLGGLRVGWIATRHRAVRARVERWLQLICGGPSALSDAAALVAVTSFDLRVSAHTEEARANAPAVYAALDAAGWSFTPAALGLTVAAQPPYAWSADALAITESAGFFLVPAATITGDPRDCRLRVSVLAEPSALRGALAMLESAVRGEAGALAHR